jgi:hypothetical protein
MNRQSSYSERLKKMKESVEKNKDLLNDEFPDDVTSTGSPDLINSEDDELDSREEKTNGKATGS